MSETAIERALALLAPEHRDRAVLHDGYLDVLHRDLPTTGTAQGLMRSDVVSRIYERWWRPALGRVAKGVFGPGMEEEHKIARLLLALEPGDGMLDVACGPGNFTRRFARSVGEAGLVVGIDASRVMLARAVAELRRDGAHNVALVHGDAAALPFRDESFDAVCCFAALHLFADPYKALDDMRRVLAPGGRIAIFTSCRGRSAPVRTFESLVGARSGMLVFEQDEIVAALRARDFGEIRQRMAGLTQFVGGRLA